MEKRPFGYEIDMVVCIDVSKSMKNTVGQLKKNIVNIVNDFDNIFDKKCLTYSSLRIRIILFNDRKKGNYGIVTTDFYNLPKDIEKFEKYVNGIEVMDCEEHSKTYGLETLAHAIRSEWRHISKNRQVIVVFTDSGAYDIGLGEDVDAHEKRMEMYFEELSRRWGNVQYPSFFINNRAKRLVLFAPDEPGWNTISDNWDMVIHFPSEVGNGLQELDYSCILDAISNAI